MGLFNLLTFVFPVTFLCIATILLAIGIHGKRIDDHPICRKCGFDLIGKPVDSMICSECGTSLSEPGQIRIGHRKKIGMLLCLCASLGVPALLVLGMDAVVVIRGVDVNRYKPLSLLVHETSSRDGKLRAAAFNEICYRLRTNQLSRKKVNALVTRALELQGTIAPDPQNEPIGLRGLCEFVELAHMAGYMTAEQWQHYATQSAVFVLDARPRVRKGDLLPVHFRRIDRTGNSRFDPLISLSTRIDGRRVESMSRVGWSDDDYSYASELLWHVWPYEPALKSLFPGEHTITVSIHAIFPGEGANKYQRVDAPTRDYEFSRRFTLLPVDELSVQQITGEPSRQAVLDAILDQRLSSNSCGTGDGRRYLRLELELSPISRLRTGFAFRAFARCGAHEWPMQPALCWDGKHSATISAATEGFDAAGNQSFDIVLRPNLEAATRTVDVESMLDDQVVLKGLLAKRAPSID